jgi:hypothetical protein
MAPEKNLYANWPQPMAVELNERGVRIKTDTIAEKTDMDICALLIILKETEKDQILTKNMIKHIAEGINAVPKKGADLIIQARMIQTQT